MPDTTVAKQVECVVAEIKHSIEQDVEFITYIPLPKLRLMQCTFHMRNSFMIQGEAVLLASGNTALAKDLARRAALKKLILIEQYLLADNMYFESMCGLG